MDGVLGTIMLFGANWAPRNWALCNGQLLAISSNTALFSIIGTTYGGDGRTTFALPDLRGRVPVSYGQGNGLTNRAIGIPFGSESTVLNASNLPAHNHSASLHVSSADSSQTAATANSTIATPGSTEGRTFTATQGFNAASPDVTMNAGSVVTGNTGGNIPLNNMQPTLAMNYVICINGIYPSRN
ncbi:MAG: tail fiber protein [Flavobacteriaceae bacterium]|nr:phage tail protein [Flavobacteriaceae bacterium]